MATVGQPETAGEREVPDAVPRSARALHRARRLHVLFLQVEEVTKHGHFRSACVAVHASLHVWAGTLEPESSRDVKGEKKFLTGKRKFKFRLEAYKYSRLGYEAAPGVLVLCPYVEAREFLCELADVLATS